MVVPPCTTRMQNACRRVTLSPLLGDAVRTERAHHRVHPLRRRSPIKRARWPGTSARRRVGPFPSACGQFARGHPGHQCARRGLLIPRKSASGTAPASVSSADERSKRRRLERGVHSRPGDARVRSTTTAFSSPLISVSPSLARCRQASTSCYSAGPSSSRSSSSHFTGTNHPVVRRRTRLLTDAPRRHRPVTDPE